MVVRGASYNSRMTEPSNSGPVSLADFDVILLNSSAGKDSQAMLTHVVGLADAQGVSRDHLAVVHADLGRVEWEGTRALAERQAAHYGLRFEVVRRDLGDLLEQIEARGMFPSSTARYCTSDQKTSQVAKLMTRLSAEHRAQHPAGGPMRILNCLGIRAQESPARAKKVPYGRDAASNGRREVMRWLPIFEWSEERVWQTIRSSGVPYHPAYDEGMRRLSCVFCVLASDSDLRIAARLNPDLARVYTDLEVRIGHTFKAGRSLADIVASTDLTSPKHAPLAQWTEQPPPKG
jgi:3'-phosphoadenosine 5'-phosphosulfate sulfotransferase (PAPS reductase)/FAD synthetase